MEWERGRSPQKPLSNGNEQAAKQIAKLAGRGCAGGSWNISRINSFLVRISAIKKPSGLGSEEAPSLPQVPPGRSYSNRTWRNLSHSPSAAALTHLCGQGKPCSVENVRGERDHAVCELGTTPLQKGGLFRPSEPLSLWTRAQRKPQAGGRDTRWSEHPFTPNERCCKFPKLPPRDNILLRIAFLPLSQISVSSPDELLIFVFSPRIWFYSDIINTSHLRSKFPHVRDTEQH